MIKITVILFLVLQTKASFFDDFAGAMSSVENAFGKLLNDVVTDVKSTMHCTILAMEQVLAMHGVVPEPINNKDCYTDENRNDLDIKLEKDNRNLYSAKDIAQEISTSISKVNISLNNVLYNDDHERLNDIKKAFINETARLTEVSFLLRQELEKISQRMKTEFQHIHLDSDKPTYESVLNDMNALYEVEKTDKNVAEVYEIGQVFNKALNVLQINTASEVKSDEDKIKAIMQELKSKSNNSNVPKSETRDQSQRKGEEAASQNKLDHKLIPEGIPSFKDVAAKLGKEVDDYVTKKSSNDDTVINEKSQTTNHVAESHNSDAKDSTPFSEMNSEDTNKAIDEAMDMIKNNAETQELLDKLFSTEQGANLFDNANLFGS